MPTFVLPLAPPETLPPRNRQAGSGVCWLFSSQVQPIQPPAAMPQPAVVIASPAPAAKPAASAPIPITCSETPTVSQLVSSKWLLEKVVEKGRGIYLDTLTSLDDALLNKLPGVHRGRAQAHCQELAFLFSFCGAGFYA